MNELNIFVFDDEWNNFKRRFAQIKYIGGQRVSFDGLKWDKKEPIEYNLKEGINTVLGMENGDISFNVILLDVYFGELPSAYECFNPLPDFDPPLNSKLIDELYGSGLPVIILTQSKKHEHVYKAGSYKLPYISKEKLYSEKTDDMDSFKRELADQVNKVINNPRFNTHTLEAENKFALNYDKDELHSPATLATILWENDRVVEAAKIIINEYAEKLKVLDIGSGTGRFEELLLTHSDISHHIEYIVATDFAPQYHIKAKERLKSLGINFENAIIFKRRIAEDIRFPEETFDLVLVAFGVPCFSDYRKSIPQAYRVLKKGGVAVFTVYNSDSLVYDFNKFRYTSYGANESFFCAEIDRKKKIMYLPGGYSFPCNTFTVSEFETELSRAGFFIPESGKDSIETFPLLYGCVKRENYQGLVKSTKKLSKGIVSYKSKELEKDQCNSGFSKLFYNMDKNISDIIKNRGHYINAIVVKPRR